MQPEVTVYPHQGGFCSQAQNKAAQRGGCNQASEQPLNEIQRKSLPRRRVTEAEQDVNNLGPVIQGVMRMCAQVWRESVLLLTFYGLALFSRGQMVKVNACCKHRSWL